MSEILKEVEDLAEKAESQGQFKLASTLYGITALTISGCQDELNQIVCRLTESIPKPLIH